MSSKKELQQKVDALSDRVRNLEVELVNLEKRIFVTCESAVYPPPFIPPQPREWHPMDPEDVG